MTAKKKTTGIVNSPVIRRGSVLTFDFTVPYFETENNYFYEMTCSVDPSNPSDDDTCLDFEGRIYTQQHLSELISFLQEVERANVLPEEYPE